MAAKDIEEHQFKKGQSGNPKGRPKNVETLLKEHFLDEHNVKLSKGQVQDIIKNVLGKSRSELVELAKNDELPFWIALIARKAQRDYEKGSIHILDVLFDRVYGKPKEEVEQMISQKIVAKYGNRTIHTSRETSGDSPSDQ